MHSLAGHRASVEEDVAPFRKSGARGTPFNDLHRKIHDVSFLRSRKHTEKEQQ